MPKKKETFVRINSRVRQDQFNFVRAEAKKQGEGEGSMHRIIIDYYIKNKK